MSAFGLRFGSTTACVAVYRDGKTDVIANDAGDRVTPAIVAFTQHEQAVGIAAKQGLIRNASNTVINVKQLLGRSRSESEVEEVAKTSKVKIVERENKLVYEVEYKDKTCYFSPVHVASVVFRKMMDIAESHGGAADSHDAVLALPLDFITPQTDAILEAAQKGDFSVQRVISEPAAALLAYDIGQTNNSLNSTVLVYRLGGSGVDATVVRVTMGMYHVLGTVSNKNLGGKQVQELIVKHFAEEFKKKWKCDCSENGRALAKLRNASETCIHVLSTMQSAHCSIDSLFEGIDFNSNLSRSRFEMLASSFIQRCHETLEEVLNKTELTTSDIQQVVVSGGCGKIPLLQQQLREKFPNAELLTSIPPDEVIAIGAAKQAGLLLGKTNLLREEVGVPALSADILLQSTNDSRVMLLEKMTPIPTRCQFKLCLEAEQTSASLLLLQQAKSSTDSLQPLAKLVLKEIPAGAQLELLLHIRSDGSLHATCTEPTSGISTSVTVDVS
uniref:Heat shock protein family A member 14 variant X1 n=1 Tax=Urechis unicinctus TaxID=6432 RepID=A0AAU0MVG6_UREUN